MKIKFLKMKEMYQNNGWLSNTAAKSIALFGKDISFAKLDF